MEEKKSVFKEMSSFTKDGRIKSSFFVYTVCLSLVFLAVHAIALMLMVNPIHEFFTGLRTPFSGGMLNLVESGIPGLTAALICNLPALKLRDKRTVPASYIMILVYAAITLITVLITYEPEARNAFLIFFGTVAALPLLLGVIVSGCVYAIYRHRKDR